MESQPIALLIGGILGASAMAIAHGIIGNLLTPPTNRLLRLIADRFSQRKESSARHELDRLRRYQILVESRMADHDSLTEYRWHILGKTLKQIAYQICWSIFSAFAALMFLSTGGTLSVFFFCAVLIMWASWVTSAGRADLLAQSDANLKSKLEVERTNTSARVARILSKYPSITASEITSETATLN